MACKQSVNTYSMMCRCPLKDAARIKALADKDKLTVSGYMAKMVSEKVKEVPITSAEEEWIAEHKEMNAARRARVDEAFATGKYKLRRKPGRPKKRGRPKGRKNTK